jgi:methylaspartate ammonia-lyase
MLSKPGLGVDEALMIQRNEMRRTLALLKAKRNKN